MYRSSLLLSFTGERAVVPRALWANFLRGSRSGVGPRNTGPGKDARARATGPRKIDASRKRALADSRILYRAVYHEEKMEKHEKKKRRTRTEEILVRIGGIFVIASQASANMQASLRLSTSTSMRQGLIIIHAIGRLINNSTYMRI